MKVKQSIITYAKEIGIDAIGFCAAEPDINRISINKERKEKKVACAFEEIQDIQFKIHPNYWLKGAKTFIVILESYCLEPENKEESSPLSVKISRASITEDYHNIVNKKLTQLKDFIADNFLCSSIAFCDSNGFSDRHIAQKAGLGVIGKNSFLINNKFGTSTFIGYLLTDLIVEEYDQPINEDYCGSCNKCINACPGQAILSNNQINARRCISYLTQAKILEEEEKKKMSNHLYGCDICQLACPYNLSKTNCKMPSIVGESIDINELLSIDNKRFNETFKKTASGWRGKKYLQRNAIIALGNYSTPESVHLLNQFYHDDRVLIRKEIVHSLGRINSQVSRDVLSKCYLDEKDTQIKKLIEEYLK